MRLIHVAWLSLAMRSCPLPLDGGGQGWGFRGPSATAARPTQDLTVTYHPDGSISIELPEEYMAALVAKINPDSTVSMECVTGPQAAAAWLGVCPRNAKVYTFGGTENPYQVTDR